MFLIRFAEKKILENKKFYKTCCQIEEKLPSLSIFISSLNSFEIKFPEILSAAQVTSKQFEPGRSTQTPSLFFQSQQSDRHGFEEDPKKNKKSASLLMIKFASLKFFNNDSLIMVRKKIYFSFISLKIIL